MTVPGEKTDCVDTVGAGDSFDAGFLHKFLRGAPLEECMRFANKVAAYSTREAGGVEAFRNTAKILGLSKVACYKWVKTGKVPANRVKSLMLLKPEWFVEETPQN